jgi:hypothetical protein
MATSSLRFVIGSLSNHDQVINAIEDLRERKVPRDSISILARQQTLDATISLASPAVDSWADLDLLSSEAGRVTCLGRGLGDLLQARVGEGSKTLKNALQRWLLPRHAQALSEIVEGGGILLWAEVHTPEQEQAATLSLLRNSRGTVEVHDFVSELAQAKES